MYAHRDLIEAKAPGLFWRRENDGLGTDDQQPSKLFPGVIEDLNKLAKDLGVEGL